MTEPTIPPPAAGTVPRGRAAGAHEGGGRGELRHPSRGRKRLPVVIVNRGETRADQRAIVKIDGNTTDVLQAFAERLPGLL